MLARFTQPGHFTCHSVGLFLSKWEFSARIIYVGDHNEETVSCELNCVAFARLKKSWSPQQVLASLSAHQTSSQRLSFLHPHACIRITWPLTLFHTCSCSSPIWISPSMVGSPICASTLPNKTIAVQFLKMWVLCYVVGKKNSLRLYH